MSSIVYGFLKTFVLYARKEVSTVISKSRKLASSSLCCQLNRCTTQNIEKLLPPEIKERSVECETFNFLARGRRRPLFPRVQIQISYLVMDRIRGRQQYWFQRQGPHKRPVCRLQIFKCAQLSAIQMSWNSSTWQLDLLLFLFSAIAFERMLWRTQREFTEVSFDAAEFEHTSQIWDLNLDLTLQASLTFCEQHLDSSSLKLHLEAY